MHATATLIEKAYAMDPSPAAWGKKLGISRTTVAAARTRGRASPTLAGALAAELGESVEHWVALAALDGEPETPAKSKLMAQLIKVRNL